MAPGIAGRVAAPRDCRPCRGSQGLPAVSRLPYISRAMRACEQRVSVRVVPGYGERFCVYARVQPAPSSRISWATTSACMASAATPAPTSTCGGPAHLRRRASAVLVTNFCIRCHR
eukprot:GHVT01104949.1.p2 GENE.GHVT01104949.1~~GHVT01104949.1.p2  ORF type:complete len:116 (-),score=11.05 GHVT01104949.1:104-451(-)